MQETDAARYFDAGQLEAIADSLEPLSGWLVRRVLPGNDPGPFAPSPGYW